MDATGSIKTEHDNERYIALVVVSSECAESENLVGRVLESQSRETSVGFHQAGRS